MIFLDMDGVLCDFHKGVENVLGIKLTPEQRSNPKLEEAVNLSKADFWKAIENHPNFWENLEPYSWAAFLWETCKKYGPVFILSSPTRHSTSCCSGKVRWLQRRFGKDFQEHIFTKHKYLLANQNRLLIDDTDKVIEKFSFHGGKVLTFPQPWNSSTEFIEDFLDKLNERLTLLYKGRRT